jgi:phage-related protein
MIARKKKISARFFANSSGRKPVREWILELRSEDRLIVGKDIQKVEFGWPIGMPSCRPLGGGLYEIRSDLSSGRITRVIFSIMNSEMVLLHGFEKKTQKTPSKDLDLARSRQKEIE